MVSTSSADHLLSSVVTLSLDRLPPSATSPVYSQRSNFFNFTENLGEFCKENFRKCDTSKENSKIIISTKHEADSDSTMDLVICFKIFCI